MKTPVQISRISGWVLFGLGFLLAATVTTGFSQTSFYVSPNGSGTSCKCNNPCSLTEGLNKAQAGDEVVLMDGVYPQSFKTVRAGAAGKPITIRSDHRHQAVIRTTSVGISVHHSNITIRGLRIDCQKQGRVGIESGRNSPGNIKNLVIEDNIVEFTGQSCIQVACYSGSSTDGFIIRHNMIRDCGFTGNGEGIYLAGSVSGSEGGSVINGEIYGNQLIRFTQNGLDCKGSGGLAKSRDIQVHHNIFEEQLYRPVDSKPGNEGTIVLNNEKAYVYNNIFRNVIDAGSSVFAVRSPGDNRVYNNVAYAIRKISKGAVYERGTGPGSIPSEVYNNTFCDLNNYAISDAITLKVYNNKGVPGPGAAQSACNAEESRILNEIKNLPPPGGYPPSPCVLTGIDEDNPSPQLTIHPNPTEGNLKLQISNYKLTVYDLKLYDLYGRLIMEKVQQSEERVSLDINHLDRGIYFLEVKMEHVKYTEKIIKQ